MLTDVPVIVRGTTIKLIPVFTYYDFFRLSGYSRSALLSGQPLAGQPLAVQPVQVFAN